MKHWGRTGIKALLAGLFALLLAACGSVVPEPEANAPAFDVAEINASLDTMAQLFASALNDENLRVQLHAAVGERFDGDTNVLYRELVTRSDLGTLGGVDVRSALAAASGLETASALHRIDALAAAIPWFQVAVPVHFDSWDAAATVPLVGYLPADFDEATTETLVAYDAAGTVHQLDARIAPDHPVVILGFNERTDLDGNLLPDYAGIGDGELVLQACKNVIVKTVLIRQTKEAWALGDPEVKLIATSGNKDVGYHGDFLSVNNTNVTYTYNRTIGCTTSDVGFYWYEDDANISGTFEVSFTIKGVTVKSGITLSNSDELFGTIVVVNSKFDGVTSTWDLGSLVFKTN